MMDVKEYLTSDKDELTLQRNDDLVKVLSETVATVLTVLTSREDSTVLSKASIAKETYRKLSDELKAKIEAHMSWEVWFEICITILSVYEIIYLSLMAAVSPEK